MYAVIETGGKQYRVEKGDVLRVEKLEGEVGDKVVFDKVFLVSDNGDTKIGTPYVEGAKVEASIKEHGKGKKIIVYKYKAKKNYHRKQGHRQPYTEIEIEAIN